LVLQIFLVVGLECYEACLPVDEILADLLDQLIENTSCFEYKIVLVMFVLLTTEMLKLPRS